MKNILLDPVRHTTLFDVRRFTKEEMELYELNEFYISTIGCKCCRVKIDLTKDELIGLYNSMIKALHFKLREIKDDD